MRDWIKFGVVILVLLSVITVFVSPSVDLEPTALRAAKLAHLLFALMALAGTMFAARLARAVAPVIANSDRDCALQAGPDIVDLNCTLLC